MDAQWLFVTDGIDDACCPAVCGKEKLLQHSSSMQSTALPLGNEASRLSSFP